MKEKIMNHKKLESKTDDKLLDLAIKGDTVQRIVFGVLIIFIFGAIIGFAVGTAI